MKRIDVTTNELVALLHSAMGDLNSHIYRVTCEDGITAPNRDEHGQVKVTPDVRQPMMTSAKRILELTALLVEE